MAAQIRLEELQSARGSDVIDAQGEKVGELEDIYYDDDSGQPEWIGVKSGMINKTKHLVPLEGAQQSDGSLRIAYPKDRVEDTPEIDDEHISPATEAELYRIYGLQAPMGYAADDQASALDEPAMGQAGETRSEPMAGRSGDTDEAGVTLHEEQARIGKQRRPAGTARLHKWVETDTVTEDVALQQDRAEVRREPVNEAAPGAELREETVEMELGREEPIVEKETRATERVALDRETDIDHEEVSTRIGREHAEVEQDDDRPGRGL